MYTTHVHACMHAENSSHFYTQSHSASHLASIGAALPADGLQQWSKLSCLEQCIYIATSQQEQLVFKPPQTKHSWFSSCWTSLGHSRWIHTTNYTNTVEPLLRKREPPNKGYFSGHLSYI